MVAGRAVRSLAHGLAPPRHRRSPRSRSCRGRTYAGLRVKSVTIRPGHSHSGLARIDRLGRTTAEKQILITLAGPYAQRRFAPHSGWRSRNQSHLNSGYDFDSVAVLIDNEHGNGRVADLVFTLRQRQGRAACRGLLATDRDRRQCTARTRNADRSRMSQAMGDAATAAGAK